MSHFTVGVICKDIEQVYNALEPYGENSDYFFERIALFTKEEYFRDNYIPAEEDIGLTTDEVWERMKRTNDIENDTLYCTCNPNPKWDWYQIGGRWPNSLKISKDAEYYNDCLKQDDKTIKGRSRWVDCARIKDIKWKDIIKLRPSDKKEIEDFWENRVEKGIDNYKGDVYTAEYYKNMYKTKENYYKSMANYSTFSLLVDPEGKWIDSDEFFPGDKTYIDVFYDYVKKPEYQDYWFVVVDCHI